MRSALDWQKEIYLNGFAGKLPVVPSDYYQLEQLAKAKLSPKAYAYLVGGAGLESTIRTNRSAFDFYQIVPRMLKDVGNRDIGINLLGKRYSSPFILSPIGVLELFHPRADLAVARGASKVPCPFIFSNQASVPMEQCAAAMGGSPRWFQLYWSKSRKLVESFVKRAEACGCEAIVVTLDTTMLGWRTRDIDLGYLPFLEGKGIAQYTSDPVFQEMLNEPDDGPAIKRQLSLQSLKGLINMVNRYPGGGFFSKLQSAKPIKAVRKFIGTYSNPSTTWSDLEFLKSTTSLPILLKGILHPDDARLAVEHGVNGIIVSNHGGRQVDGSISSIEALPAVVEAVDNKIPVLLDSGVRGGADAFKALALGAAAVCIGRPYAFGLAIAGEAGVSGVIQNYIADFELTMGLSGCRSVSDITLRSIRQKQLAPIL